MRIVDEACEPAQKAPSFPGDQGGIGSGIGSFGKSMAELAIAIGGRAGVRGVMAGEGFGGGFMHLLGWTGVRRHRFRDSEVKVHCKD